MCMSVCEDGIDGGACRGGNALKAGLFGYSCTHCPLWYVGVGRFVSRRLVIHLYLLSPDPSHLSRRDKTWPDTKGSHLSRRDKTFGCASENFIRALRARDYIYRKHIGPCYGNIVRAEASYSQACHTFIQTLSYHPTFTRQRIVIGHQCTHLSALIDLLILRCSHLPRKGVWPWMAAVRCGLTVRRSDLACSTT